MAVAPEPKLQLVLRYVDACKTGDIEQLKSTPTDAVVHYFLPPVHPPIRDQLARYRRKFKQVYRPSW